MLEPRITLIHADEMWPVSAPIRGFGGFNAIAVARSRSTCGNWCLHGSTGMSPSSLTHYELLWVNGDGGESLSEGLVKRDQRHTELLRQEHEFAVIRSHVMMSG